MRHRVLIIAIVSVSMFAGCALKHAVKGEYFLSQKKYSQGIRSFQDELTKYPEEPRVHYYLGRFHMAEDNPEDGLTHMKKAVALEPSNADYHFWLGVAYSGNKQPEMERRSYEKSLALNSNHLKSRIYLAHTQMDKRQYQEALANYSLVLEKQPDEPASLYNRAWALNKLGRTQEEPSAWKAYLDYYSSGSMARSAVLHLNYSGDFSYRNHLIGQRTLTMKRIAFEPLGDTLTSDSKDSLAFLGQVLTNAKKVSIHIVAYQKDNERLAEQRAKAVKKYLLERFPEIIPSRLNVAWFGVPESIKVGQRRFMEDESIHFITAVGK